MKKMTIAITVVIVIALIGTLYLYADSIEKEMHLTKPALKITATTGYNDTLGEIQITNMTFEQTTVPIYFRSVDSPAVFPDIDIEGKNSSITAVPITYWQSQKRENTEGNYTFVLTFREPYVPKKDEVLFLAVRMNDFRGVLVYKQTVFYAWK
ncbi:MAG: hypothetical protein O8C64_12560 [Candidatus Methanoperedens sp.]|nr:hypothetical protein [Candidatus Methanoperedens sp.]MCZ7405672.1 hypothetical protein [Candidatus Methanoperedens sp.]